MGGSTMSRVIWLIVLVVAIPLVSFGVSTAVQTRLNLDYRGGLHVSGLDLTNACASPSSDLKGDCDLFRAAGLTKHAALVSAAVGVTLLASIGIVGYAAC